jgi:hypothetical protein
MFGRYLSAEVMNPLIEPLGARKTSARRSRRAISTAK